MTEVTSSSTKKPNQKKSEINGVALKTRYFTPSEAYIPPLGGSRAAHYPIPVNRNISPKAMLTAANVLSNNIHDVSLNANKTELDGFMLLEAAGLGFPEEVEHINLSDRHLKTVVEEDLTYFNELLYMDISENQLPFLSFGALPKLRELRMACNFISVIEDDIYGFNHLMFLDLSYNQLTIDSILALSALPRLKELDLSGNNLKTLPPDLSTFQSLDKLLLQYNKLDNNDIFLTLTTIPNLRSLDVSHNYFSKFPIESCSADRLRFLDTLDISFNYFSREENIEPLIHLPRLLTVMLYGNPLLGPTGEDPMFVYIEETLEKAHHVREQQNSSIPDIEFITEVPRRRILKKGQPLGRLALYRDFSIVQVDGNISTKSNREWRKQGTQTLFAEAIANQKRQQALQVSSNVAAPPDFTFITNSLAPSNQFSMHLNGGINYADADGMADGVMMNVAREMGLANPIDIQILEEYANLPPSALVLELEKSVKKPIYETNDDFMGGYDSAITAPTTPVIDLVTNRDNELVPQDRVPAHLFATTIAQQGVPATIAGQPIALKTAMKALQRAIEQPLTNYDEVPSKWSNKSNDFLRSTAISQIRQLPRIPRPAPAFDNETDNKNDSKSSKYHSKGLAESDAYKNVRAQNRERTLEQIDQVLQRLNENTQKVTTADPANGTIRESASMDRAADLSGVDGDMLLGANSYNNPFATNGLVDNSRFHVNVQKTLAQASTSNMKQSMDRMRYFARPAGVKHLMNMVDEIVDEFNS